MEPGSDPLLELTSGHSILTRLANALRKATIESAFL